MQNIFWEWGVKQQWIRGSFWHCATKSTEKEREREVKNIIPCFCQVEKLLKAWKEKQSPKWNKMQHLTWMCLCISRNCRYAHRTIHVNNIFLVSISNLCEVKRYFHTPLYCMLSFSSWFTFVSVPAKFNKNMENKLHCLIHLLEMCLFQLVRLQFCSCMCEQSEAHIISHWPCIS